MGCDPFGTTAVSGALERMVDRNFTETDLRDMLERASGYPKSRRARALGCRNAG
jgi:hypothetical protein